MKFRMSLLTAVVLTAGLGLVGCGNDSTTSLTPDTTPPLAPVILGARGGEGTISVWWNQNTEPDLDGYNVYVREGSSLVRLNRRPTKSTYYIYHPQGAGSTQVQVTAVDKSGNESAASTKGVRFTDDGIDGIDGGLDKVIDGQQN